METELLGHDEQDCGILVYDETDSEHRITIEWDGTIRQHTNEDYPPKREDRTLKEQKLMTQVENRAKFAAQQEFPQADILDPEWNPHEIQRAIQALGTMHVDDFQTQFKTCYGMVTQPETFDGVTPQHAQLIFQPVFITDDNTIGYVATPVLQYHDGDHTTATDPDPHITDQSGTQITITLPPLDFDPGAYEFPDGFQVFLIEHLHAQIRDCYRHMGEQPPADYDDMDDDFPGLVVHAAHDEYYDDF